ncbi:MAG: WbqC family protein [Cyclobacteriaceae bacterium]
MNSLLIESHYLGSLEYLCLIQNYDEVVIEVSERFRKQTFRNRTYLLGSNKILPLSIPVNYSGAMATKDVKVEYSARWVKDHWGAVYSSYGKAPFFEFFADELKNVWEKKPEFLVDLNSNMLNVCLKLLNVKIDIVHTEVYMAEPPDDQDDFRDAISPKVEFSRRNIYLPKAYSQLFGNSFVPNLSIIDLLMCEGPRASEILAQSYRGNNQVGNEI